MKGRIVRISSHDPGWQGRFEAEAERIRAALAGQPAAIEHVGSTAVQGLDAKPTIDILVGLSALEAGEIARGAMERLGYTYRGEAGVPGRIFFRKGVSFPRDFNVHFVQRGGPLWRQMLDFRDYLRQHPETALEYGALKTRLVLSKEGRRLEGYAAGKETFIAEVLRKARAGGGE